MTSWIIVGGGTAGCVLANRLSSDDRHHVTLVEAGPDRIGESSASYLDALQAPGRLWSGLMVSDGDLTTRPYPQGRGLGGSSAVNGTVLSGGELDQYRRWGWSGWAAARGRSQIPAQTVPIAELGPVDRALLGSVRGGVRAVLSRRAGACVSSAAAYLDAARHRSNVEVVTDTLVDRVVTDGRVATGILTAAGDRLHADRVVCAAGAIYTPALLLRSGIAVDGIGVGLADHPSRVVELALQPDAAADPHSLVTGAALRRGAIEIVTMNHLGTDRPGSAALLVGLLQTHRRGRVGLDPDRPDDPLAPPVVDFGPNAHPDDVRRLADGVALAQRVLASPSFARVIDGFSVGRGDGGYAHASSSCPMGTVVDRRGAVIGYEGLSVADASVFPEIPASGTYLPVIVLAERLAHLWLTR